MGTPPFPEISPTQVQGEFELAVEPGARVREVTPLRKAYGHLGFLLQTEQGGSWLVKIARIPAEIQRFQRTREATELALAAGVPAPEIIHTALSERFGGLPYMVQAYLPGNDAEDAWPSLSAVQQEHFLTELGKATARLHGISGKKFTENTVEPPKAARWEAHVDARLEHLRKLNTRWLTVPAGELIQQLGRLQKIAARTAPYIVPTLTHRDLFLSNALANQGHFAAILDFEHARFSDPLMEFVKLETLLFEKHPGSREPFMRGYQQERPEPYPRAGERLTLCWGLELLGAIPFYARNQNEPELEAALRRLRALAV